MDLLPVILGLKLGRGIAEGLSEAYYFDKG
jgi:hypothetical protein